MAEITQELKVTHNKFTICPSSSITGQSSLYDAYTVTDNVEQVSGITVDL